MASKKRRVNTETLDVKIEQQKATLEKAKVKYETEKKAKPFHVSEKNLTMKDEAVKNMNASAVSEVVDLSAFGEI